MHSFHDVMPPGRLLNLCGKDHNDNDNKKKKKKNKNKNDDNKDKDKDKDKDNNDNNDILRGRAPLFRGPLIISL